MDHVELVREHRDERIQDDANYVDKIVDNKDLWQDTFPTTRVAGNGL